MATNFGFAHYYLRSDADLSDRPDDIRAALLSVPFVENVSLDIPRYPVGGSELYNNLGVALDSGAPIEGLIQHDLHVPTSRARTLGAEWGIDFESLVPATDFRVAFRYGPWEPSMMVTTRGAPGNGRYACLLALTHISRSLFEVGRHGNDALGPAGLLAAECQLELDQSLKSGEVRRVSTTFGPHRRVEFAYNLRLDIDQAARDLHQRLSRELSRLFLAAKMRSVRATAAADLLDAAVQLGGAQQREDRGRRPLQFVIVSPASRISLGQQAQDLALKTLDARRVAALHSRQSQKWLDELNSATSPMIGFQDISDDLMKETFEQEFVTAEKATEIVEAQRRSDFQLTVAWLALLVPILATLVTVSVAIIVAVVNN